MDRTKGTRMTSRKDYVEKMSASLKEVNAELKTFQAIAKDAGKKTAARITQLSDAARPHVVEEIKYLKAKQKDLETRIKGLKGPSKAAWKDLSVAIDLAWKDLKKGVVSARSHFKEETPKSKSKTKAPTKAKAKAKAPTKERAKSKSAKPKSKR